MMKCDYRGRRGHTVTRWFLSAVKNIDKYWYITCIFVLGIPIPEKVVVFSKFFGDQREARP